MDGREEGWLRLWRKLRDSRVFSHPDPWLLKIWVWCLLEAGWKPCWKRGCETPIGAFVTDYSQAATQLNTSRSKVYRTLQTLAEWGQIRLEVKRSFTVVTICNWWTYQAEEVSERNATETQVKRRRNATETTSVEEEGKKDRREEGARAAFRKPTLEEVRDYCRERHNGVDPQAFLDHYESNGWRVGKAAMKDWRAAVRTWERNESHFRGNGKAAPDLFGGIEEFVKGGPFRDP